MDRALPPKLAGGGGDAENYSPICGGGPDIETGTTFAAPTFPYVINLITIDPL